MDGETKIRLCLIEDDQDVIDAIQLAYRRDEGVSLDVKKVETAEQLVDLPDEIVAGDYHVLLVDLGLPSSYSLDERWKAGLDLLKALDGGSCRAVPIVLTGYDDVDNYSNYIETARRGARTLIAKKGLSWDVLRAQVMAAHAYWLLEEERRLSEERVEEERRLSEERVEEERRLSEERVRHLAAQLVHDLNGSIWVFVGTLEAVAEETGAIAAKDLETLGRSRDDAKAITSYLQRILGDTADLKRKPKWKTVSVDDFLEVVWRMAEKMNRAFKKIATLGKSVECQGMAELDVPEFRRALNNLIINGLRSMSEHKEPGQGSLSLTAKQEDDSLVIELSDNGAPISSEQFHHGAGLGLGICREIVEERHGGKFSAHANENGGTTFVLKIPLRQPKPDAG